MRPIPACAAPQRLECAANLLVAQGYAGPMCERMLFPACRITLEPHLNGALLRPPQLRTARAAAAEQPWAAGFPHAMRCYMGSEPKACDCHRQCWKHQLIKARLACPPQPAPAPACAPAVCRHAPQARVQLTDRHVALPCFERAGLPPSRQTSAFPEDDEEFVIFRSHYDLAYNNTVPPCAACSCLP